MRINKDYVALVVLLGALGGLLWKRSHAPASGQAGSPAVETVSAGGQRDLQGPTPQPLLPGTERQWVMEEICRDIAEITAFAVKGEKLDPTVVNVAVTADGTGAKVMVQGPVGGSVVLGMEHFMWAPQDYQPLAAALLKGAGLQPVAAADNKELPATLTNPEMGVLIKEGSRLSAALSKQPLAAALHEEAALVVGTLALREAAGKFSDIRPALGRMAAHLAIARALSASPGANGELAETVLLTLVKRQAEALDHVAKLSSELAPWTMALKLRNTGDWRLLPAFADATLLEQIALVQAMAPALTPARVAGLLKQAKAKDMPDWARICLGTNISVEDGHRFASPSIERELEEINASGMAFNGARVAGDKQTTLLNTPEGRAVHLVGGASGIEVLGWGAVARFHQRHLMHVVDRTHYFFADMWGEPDEDAKLLDMASRTLSGLQLYPLLAGMSLNDGEAGARDQAADFCEAHPSLVTAKVWAQLYYPPERNAPGRRPSNPDLWFGNTPPPGTGFSFETLGCGLAPDFLAEARRIAPYDFDVLHRVAESSPPGYESVAQIYKTVSDYHVDALRCIAKAAEYDNEAYRREMEKLSALDPDGYVSLAGHLVKMGDAEAAARAYEQAFAKATNRVMVANNSEWLVNYYMDKGRQKEALEIAGHAAEVYSYRGLETAGRLMARLGRLEEAAKLFAAIAERYGDPGPVMRFIAAHKEDAKFKGPYDGMVARLFKDGLPPAALADFKEAPAGGAEITSESDGTRAHGLRPGDVIVALDGVRVDTEEQYMFVRALKEDNEPLQLIVWDGVGYRAITASLPKRRFECEMKTHRS